MRYLYIILFLIFQSNIFAQITALQIIENNYKLSNSQNFAKNVKQFELKTTFVKNNHGIPFTIRGKMPDLFRLDMKIESFNFVKISKGYQTTHYNPVTDSITTTTNKSLPLSNFIKEWLAVIDTVNSTNIELIGLDKIEDIEVYQIKVDKGEKSTTYFVDKMNFLVLRIDKQNGATRMYQDYRQIENYVFPFRVSVYKNQRLDVIMQSEAINLNPDIDNSTFELKKRE